MEPRLARRWLGIAAVALGMLLPMPGQNDDVKAGVRKVDPSQVLPLDQVTPQFRDAVAEVVRDAHFHRQGKSDTFPCNPRTYMKLLNEPLVTLTLWKDLGESPAVLQQIGPNRFQGTDGAGTSATWEYALRSPRLNVLLCDLDYTSPRGAAKLQGRIVLIVRSAFFREATGEFWVKHDIEAFVKIDSRGWKAVGVTLRPLIEKLLEDQVEEAGMFVSLMGRLVETYPNWAIGVVSKQPAIDAGVRTSFVEVVNQTRRPAPPTEGRRWPTTGPPASGESRTLTVGRVER